MRTRDPRSGGAQGVDGWYNVWRSGAPGPHAHGNAARQVVDDRRAAEVRGQQKLSANAERHQQEHRPQRPTKCSNPTQHAKGRTSACPGPRKETATQQNVTQGG